MNGDLVQYVLSNYYGIKEVPGEDSHPEILRIIQWAMPSVKDDSSAAWCAIFISKAIDECCSPFPAVKAARSFLNHFTKVDKPQYGDIVIFWRGSRNGWKGHVGLYIREDETHIWVLGGNQENQVNIRRYTKSRVLGYRRVEL